MAAIPAHVIERYSRDKALGMDHASADHVELAKFLILSMGGSRKCVPSKYVDDVWHNFILHTREYRAFCESVLGYFVDHSPAKPGDDVLETMATYNETRARLEILHGSLNEKVWPKLDERLETMKNGCRNDCRNCMSECH